MKRPEGFDRGPVEPHEPPDAGAQRSSRTPRAQRSAPSPKVEKPAKPPRPPRSPRSREQHDTVPIPIISPATDHEHAPAESKAEERARRRHEKAQARRFTRNSRRRRITWLAVSGVVVILLGILAVAVFSPILALRTITVVGAKEVKASAIRQALDAQLGTPLALLNDAKIDKQLSQFTLIRSYVTEIVPPNTLVVRIQERQAIGVLADGNSYDQVDPAGVVLRTSASRSRLPIIDIGSARPGGAAFQAAVKVLLAMPTSLLAKVQTISASSTDSVSLTLAGSKHTVIWGSAADSDQKAATLASMLGVAKCRSEVIIDVTAPLFAGCRPADSTSTPTATPTPTGTATP